jgi:ribose transport system substrate-binding protein
MGLKTVSRFLKVNGMKSLLKFLGCVVSLLIAVQVEGAAGKTLQIAVIPKGTSHEFWKSIHAGAAKAEQELNKSGQRVKITWKGPLREDDREQQIALMENFVARRVDGIVLAPLDNSAMVAPVENALRAGIPVVIIDSGIKSDKPISYIATDNFKGGQLGAQQLAKILNGRGKVILLRYQVGSASTEEREAGFLDAIKKFPDITLISTDQRGGATRDTSYQAAQNLLNRYGKEVDGIFAPCEPVTVGVLMALRDAGKGGGSIKLVGFDAGTQSVEALKNGDLQGLVVQNPMKMGYLGVNAIVDYLNNKSVAKKVDTGVSVVTKENMEQPEFKEVLYPPLDKYLK